MLRSSRDGEAPHGRRTPWFVWPVALALALLVSASALFAWCVVSPTPVRFGKYFLTGPRCSGWQLRSWEGGGFFVFADGGRAIGIQRMQVGPVRLCEEWHLVR